LKCKGKDVMICPASQTFYSTYRVTWACIRSRPRLERCVDYGFHPPSA
jgi:hypothetical protein